MTLHSIARIGVLACLLALAGCSGHGFGASQPAPTATAVPTPTPAGHDINGTLTLNLLAALPIDVTHQGECQGASGYDDIVPGAEVLLKDGDGHTLAVANLGPGHVTERAPGADGYTFVNCQFAFTMTAIPDRPFYTFSIGHRGAPTYAHDELAARGWSVAMTLG